MDYKSTILADTPQAYYQLDEVSGSVATDRTGNGYNGTLTGATYLQNGAIVASSDKAILFTANGGLALPYTLNPSTWAAASLEFWFSSDGAAWHHIVVTTNASATVLYLDGAVTSSGSGASVFVDIDLNFAGAFSVAAYLDEVAIYNYVLTSGQVSNHYTVGTSAAVLTPPVTPTPRVVTNLQTYQVRISDNPVFVEAGSLLVDKSIGKRSTARFIAHTDTATHFEQYEEVQIYDAANILVFSGYITQPKEQKPGWQNSLRHTITCVDQHYLADKRVIGKAYTNKTCGAIVADIVTSILSQEGVTVGQIYDGLAPSTTLFPSPGLYPQGNVGAIPSATFVYCTVAQALDALVKQASAAGVPYYWQIDENMQLWFVPYTAIINSTIIDGMRIDDGTRSGVLPSVTRQNPTYRNTQYIAGGVAQTAVQTETRLGDGHSQAWIMGYELASRPTITVDGVAKTTGVKGSKGADFYWGPKDAIITQDSAATKLTSSNVLQVVYIGQYPAIFYAQDPTQINYQQSIDGTSGIVEVVDTDATIISSDAGFSEASQFLTRYAKQGKQFVGATQQAGYAQGQLVTVNYQPFALSNVQMLIEKVSISDQADGYNLWQTITGVVGPYDLSWQDFFSKFFKQNVSANNINIGISQTLTLFKEFSITLSPSITLTGHLYTVPVPSTSLWPSPNLYPG